MENNNIDSKKSNRPDRHGINNPMWSRHHRESSKQLMKAKALERNKKFNQWKNSQQVSPMSMGQCLTSPPVKECLVKIIREEIERMLWNEQNPQFKS